MSLSFLLVNIFLSFCLSRFSFYININIRLNLEVDEIKNDIQKSRLRSFVDVMQMTEKRISYKMLLIKMERKRPIRRPQTRWTIQIKKDIKMRVRK